VAWLTFLSSMRQRVLGAAMALSVLLVVLAIAAGAVAMGEQSRLVLDVGFATASLVGTLIAIFLTVQAFASEIAGQSAYPTLVRPVARFAFVVGKYLGIFGTMVSVVLCVTATAMVAAVACGATPATRWLQGLAVTGAEMALVVAVALLFASLAVPSLAIAYSVGFVLLGNLSADIEQVAIDLQTEGHWLGLVMEAFHTVLPDFDKLSLRAQIANDLPAEEGYVVAALLYVCGYAGALVGLAAWHFGRRRQL